MDYYTAIKKNEIFFCGVVFFFFWSFVTTWVDLRRRIILSEISLNKKEIPYNFTYVESKQINKQKQE